MYRYAAFALLSASLHDSPLRFNGFIQNLWARQGFSFPSDTLDFWSMVQGILVHKGVRTAHPLYEDLLQDALMLLSFTGKSGRRLKRLLDIITDKHKVRGTVWTVISNHLHDRIHRDRGYRKGPPTEDISKHRGIVDPSAGPESEMYAKELLYQLLLHVQSPYSKIVLKYIIDTGQVSFLQKDRGRISAKDLRSLSKLTGLTEKTIKSGYLKKVLKKDIAGAALRIKDPILTEKVKTMLSSTIRRAASNLTASPDIDLAKMMGQALRALNREYPFKFRSKPAKVTDLMKKVPGRRQHWLFEWESQNREFPGTVSVAVITDRYLQATQALIVYSEPKGHASQDFKAPRPVQYRHLPKTIESLLSKAAEAFGDAFEDFGRDDPDSDFYSGYDESWKDDIFTGGRTSGTLSKVAAGPPWKSLDGDQDKLYKSSRAFLFRLLKEAASQVKSIPEFQDFQLAFGAPGVDSARATDWRREGPIHQFRGEITARGTTPLGNMRLTLYINSPAFSDYPDGSSYTLAGFVLEGPRADIPSFHVHRELLPGRPGVIWDSNPRTLVKRLIKDVMSALQQTMSAALKPPKSPSAWGRFMKWLEEIGKAGRHSKPSKEPLSPIIVSPTKSIFDRTLLERR